MKKFLMVFVCLMTMVVSANAQETQTDKHEVYCIIVGTEKFMSTKVTVTIDYGQEVKFWDGTSKMKMVDDNGEVIKFNSMVDACNYLSSMGWTFVNAYAASSNQGNCYHFLMKKTINKGDNVGIKTKGNTSKGKEKKRETDGVY